MALPLFLALLAGQDQQLGVGCQHCAYGVLKFAPGGNPPLDLLHPISGDALDLSLPLGGHEGEYPRLMAFVVCAMAAGIPAAGVTPGEVSRQQIGRDGETAKKLKLLLAEARGLRATWFVLHMRAVNLQVSEKNQALSD